MSIETLDPQDQVGPNDFEVRGIPLARSTSPSPSLILLRVAGEAVEMQAGMFYGIQARSRRYNDR
jgi:hypothetical protein